MPPHLRLVFKGNMWIFERPNPLPRLFLPATALGAEGRVFHKVSAIENFADFAMVDRWPLGQKDWTSSRPEASTLEIVKLDATRVRARAHLGEQRLLASSIFQDGGWRLLVDGEPAQVCRTNGAFVGAWLEPGDHELELIYRPPGFLVGCLLAALALVTGFVYFTPPPKRIEGRRLSRCILLGGPESSERIGTV